MGSKSQPISGVRFVQSGPIYIRGQSVGIKIVDTRQLIKVVKKGLDYAAITKLEKESGISVESLGAIIQIPARTLARRKKAGRFAPPESERLLRVGMIFEKATELFEGDRAAAKRWLSAPCKALGGEPPLVMTQTEVGAREVEDLIGRLEHGVFS